MLFYVSFSHFLFYLFIAFVLMYDIHSASKQKTAARIEEAKALIEEQFGIQRRYRSYSDIFIFKISLNCYLTFEENSGEKDPKLKDSKNVSH